MANSRTETIVEKLRASGYSPKVMDHDPVITMKDVVETLDIPADEMAKTLLLHQREIGLIAVVLPGMNRVDFSKVANSLEVSRKSLKVADETIMADLGLKPGDMCPFYDFFEKIIVDTSLITQPFVYCGSGDSRKTIQIATQELVEATSGVVTDISKTVSTLNQTN